VTSQEFEDPPTEQLVARFIEVAQKMGAAVLDSETQRFNRLFPQMEAIDQELRARGREARMALSPLLENGDRFVRYYAAKYMIGLLPGRARSVIEEVAKYKYDALCGDAAMCLYALDKGISKPD
jgi:hypothetical protein